MKKSKLKLATLPSKFLLQALKDLEWNLQDGTCMVNMNRWQQRWDGKCTVCLGGAIMRKQLGPLTQEGESRDVDVLLNSQRRILIAIDRFRTGCLEGALESIKKKLPKDMPKNILAPEYDGENPLPFKLYIMGLSQYLKGFGL